MAATAVDLFVEPKLVAKAKETFKEEIGDTEYPRYCRPFKSPRWTLDRDLMERYLPATREHYVKEKPLFV